MRVLEHNSIRLVQAEACIKVRTNEFPTKKSITRKKVKTPSWKAKSTFHSFDLRPVDLQYLKSLSIITGHVFEIITSNTAPSEEDEQRILAKIADN